MIPGWKKTFMTDLKESHLQNLDFEKNIIDFISITLAFIFICCYQIFIFFWNGLILFQYYYLCYHYSPQFWLNYFLGELLQIAMFITIITFWKNFMISNKFSTCCTFIQIIESLQFSTYLVGKLTVECFQFFSQSKTKEWTNLYKL